MTSSARHRRFNRGHRIPVRAGASSALAQPPLSQSADALVPEVKPDADPGVIESEPRSSKEEVWRDRALRLQAEMDKTHKRQQPTGQERILQATEGCTMFSIRNVLVIADNLDRTLAAAAEDTLTCRGVALTRDELVRLLQKV